MDVLPRSWLRPLVLALVPLVAAGCVVARATRMPGTSFAGEAPPLPPELAELPTRLELHVRQLAEVIGARGEHAPHGLSRAETYVHDQLVFAGYAVETARYQGRTREVANLRAERRGRERPDEIVLVGAHYDSVEGTPGADDNASGVAALIELARLFATRDTARTVRFVAWVNEEPPSFQRETMGSLVDARASRARGDDLRAVFSLESVGFYSDAPDSQRYPSPFDRFYPSVGNFVGFVGSFGDPALVRRAVGTFRAHAHLPSEGVAAPSFIPGVGWSDHWSYQQVGYPAVMVTGTAPFRNPHYHEAGDTPEKLDYARLARVVEGMVGVIDAEAR